MGQFVGGVSRGFEQQGRQRKLHTSSSVAILPKSPMSDRIWPARGSHHQPKRAPIRRNTAGVRHSPFPQVLIPPPRGSGQETASMPPPAVSLTPRSPMPSITLYLVSLWSSVGWFCGRQSSVINIFNSQPTTRRLRDSQLGLAVTVQ